MHTASVKEQSNFYNATFPTDNKELKLVEFCRTVHLSYVDFHKVASWGHSSIFNIFINDLNFVTRIASLHLYADNTTT